MSELQDTLTQDHIKLVESINHRVDSIYKHLCEYEESIDPRTLEDYGDSQTKIMDLLETLETIQEAAQRIRPFNLELRSRQQALEEQMKCLEQSVVLMKLETGSGDSQMQE
ncbi:uncharacterized protein LOC119606425 [Lucilia sericata]|uniref:uncharacterized protein LOC119606425 n=1 Tax=Lucilia sericata TaxID=13632 RepID=UPI0018A8613F|nr:uncharacterized protein LOC119606425 [Lucilia sericata]